MNCFSRVVHVGQARWGLPPEHASHSVINMGSQRQGAASQFQDRQKQNWPREAVSRTRDGSPTVSTEYWATKDRDTNRRSSSTYGDDNHEQNVGNLTRDSNWHTSEVVENKVACKIFRQLISQTRESERDGNAVIQQRKHWKTVWMGIYKTARHS
jgi:hypothetical protein